MELCLYAAMQAWLALAPEEDGPTNAERFDEGLPAIDDDWCHLPEWLRQAGTAVRDFSGVAPLPPTEIESWARLARVRLSEFEARALLEMSRVFAHVASDRHSPCPLADDEVVGASLDAAAIARWKAFAVKDVAS